ncbi:hypothetical protein [Polaromonas sp. UC242_47]|uniref:hypothetical protein n=1 Tax=Polaromonas sp. UC242_47 TaxID=3374626 RepID=UPI0037A86DA2
MNTRRIGRIGQVIAVLGVGMSFFSAQAYGGAINCRGWDQITCFFHAIFWLLGSQLVAAPLQWIGVKNTRGKERVLTLLGAVISTLVALGLGATWLSFHLAIQPP